MAVTAGDFELALSVVADSAKAPAMRAYMRDQFAFLGAPTPTRRKQLGPLIKRAQRELSESAILILAEALWALPEREYQYAAVDLLARCAGKLDVTALAALQALVLSKSWWDTVDGLATAVIGDLVRRHPVLQGRMDVWSRADDVWLRRVAILHQLRWKQDTDAGRLFRYCSDNATDSEFFIRKAIGWALREYAYTNPDAVRGFVNTTALSPLSRREALKNLTKEKR